MQSFVVAPGVFLSHSITVFASTGGESEGVIGFRFFDEAAEPGDGTVPFGSSVALRFLLVFWPEGSAAEAVGLLARLPLVCVAPLANGLVLRAPFRPGLGGLGLVARLATTEWPPSPGATGEVARDPAPDGTDGRAGVWEREGGCDGG